MDMGERTTISGHIQEPWYTPGGDAQLRAFRNANSRVLRSLPVVDQWPFFHRGMFVRSRQGRRGGSSSFRGTVVYFGGSFSSLYQDIDKWKAKFEAMLRSMYWEHAALLVVTEWMGIHHYVWRPTSEAERAMFSVTPQPIGNWEIETSRDAI